MLKISIDVIGDHRSRDKVGRILRDAMAEQLGATPWEMSVTYFPEVGFKADGAARYSNEGRAGL